MTDHFQNVADINASSEKESRRDFQLQQRAAPRASQHDQMMLKKLKIENVSVVAQIEIELGTGLIAITGETGAGKSIMIDALGWLTGERVPAGVVRTGCERASIEGSFVYVSSASSTYSQVDTGTEESLEIKTILAALKESGELKIRRDIHASGKNSVQIAGQRASVATLRQLRRNLVEIHDQGGQHTLLDTASQMQLLDAFANNETERREAAKSYLSWRKTLEELRRVQSEKLERQRVGELLKFQLEELQTLAPRAGEDTELETELQLHANAESRAMISARVYEELLERDESVATRLAACRKDLEKLKQIDERVSTLLENLESARIQLSDVAEELRQYNARIDFSATRLREIEERLADLDRFKRKYGKDLPQLENLREELLQRTARFEELESLEADITKRLITSSEAYMQAATKLSLSRKRVIKRFESGIACELRALAMGEARFIVELKSPKFDNKDLRASVDIQSHSPEGWSVEGWDNVQFLLSANPGEELQELTRVASGGELSRLMLALKIVSADPARETAEMSTTLVFDEIDVGISGKTADAVGRRLASLAQHQQVLCVTHQPQIAKFADQHLSISKYVEEQRTYVRVRNLSKQEQVGELARLISGDETDQFARSTAARLIEQTGVSGVGAEADSNKNGGKTVAKTETGKQRKKKTERVKSILKDSASD